MLKPGPENMGSSVSLGVHSVEEDRERQQYFFDTETAERLASLCEGRTACLCTPSVAEVASRNGNDEIVLFDIDPRVADFGGRFEQYDLYRGLHSSHQENADRLTPELEYSFDTVIVDPPFSGVSPDRLAENINALLKWDIEGETYVYIIYPLSGAKRLEEAMEARGMVGQLREDMPINYVRPPKIHTPDGDKRIVLFQFRRV